MAFYNVEILRETNKNGWETKTFQIDITLGISQTIIERDYNFMVVKIQSSDYSISSKMLGIQRQKSIYGKL